MDRRMLSDAQWERIEHLLPGKPTDNCATSVIHALRRAGYQCPAWSFKKFRQYWLPRSSVLQLGQTPIAAKGMQLFTREHFLLLHSDANADGAVDENDFVIHAYYRPVEVTTIRVWRQLSPNYPIHYIPIDDAFACPVSGDAASQ